MDTVVPQESAPSFLKSTFMALCVTLGFALVLGGLYSISPP